MLINDQAICIRTTDYSETSQILTLFTQDHGKIGAIAKGSKRAKSSFGGTVELFTHGPVLYLEAARGGLNTLREFEPRHDVVAALSRNMYGYYCSLLAGELLNKLTQEHDPHPELYACFLDFLRQVSGAAIQLHGASDILSEPRALGLLIHFQLALLSDIGLKLRIDSCGNCHGFHHESTDEAYFSSQLSSLICRDCEASYPDRLPLTPRALSCLRSPSQVAQAPEDCIRDLARLLLHHFTNLLHQRPKTAKYVII